MHSLIDFKEITFYQLYYENLVCILFDYHNVLVAANYANTNVSSLLVLSSCLPGSYFIQLNAKQKPDYIYHVVAIHIKCHWSKLSLPTDTVTIITDDTTVEV